MVLSADLKITLNPRVHWVGTAVLALPLATGLAQRVRRGIPWTKLLAPACLIGLIIVNGVVNHFWVYHLEEALKLSVILLGAYTLVLVWPELSRAALEGIRWAVYINLGLLLAGMVFMPALGREMAIGRYGTILNYPGSLARLGVLGFAGSAYLALRARNYLKDAVLAGASSLLVYLDGSRSGLLALALLVCFFLLVVMRERARDIVTVALPRMLFIAGASALTIALFSNLTLWMSAPSRQQPTTNGTSVHTPEPSAASVISQRASVPRAEVTASNIVRDGLVAGLEKSDAGRFSMIKAGLKAASNHFILGSGMGSTALMTPSGPMDVHLTYLQLWGDLGFAGLVAYLFLIGGWVTTLPRTVKWLGSGSLQQRAMGYGAILMLVFFAYNGLFHPFSTEWSEWATFLIPVGIYHGLGKAGD